MNAKIDNPVPHQELDADLVANTEKLKELNQQLILSEQRLRLAIEAGRVGLWVWNSTDVNNPGDWSPRLKEIFGLPLETEVTHEIFLRCVHPEDREKINRLVMEALKGVNGGHYETEYRIIDPKDASVRWVAAQGHAFFGPLGDAVRFIGTLVDITERKRSELALGQLNADLETRISQRVAELAKANAALQNEVKERKRIEVELRQNQAYLAEAQRLSLTGSFGWVVSTGEFFWSDETFCIYGLSRSAPLTLELILSRVHPEDLASVKDELARATKSGSGFDFSHRLLFEDGTVRHVHVKAKASKNAAGMFEFIGAVQDISERARAAEALRTSELLARGQVETLKEILNVISTDLNPDKFLQHILCTIAKQMGGQSVSVFSRNNDDSQTFELSCDGNHIHIPDEKVVHPTDDQPLWAEAMRIGTECLITEFDRDPIWFRFVNRPVSEGVPRINEKTSPVTVEVHRKLKAQGNALSLQIPMVTSGRVSGFVGIRFTKRREFKPEEIDLSRALAHQAAFALELMRLSRESRQTAIMGERNRMARDIHDTLAQGFTGVIMQLEAAKGASTQGNANEVANRIDRAEALARSSLGEARRSVRALRPKELRDGKLCEALENLFKRMTDGTDINAEFHTEGSVKSVPAEYEEALLRIAQESLTNALKHSGAKFVKGTLRVEGDKIQFQFVDSGKGFHPQGDYDGFGLIGMKERVEGMGGEFIIRSKPGEGTEIVVELKIENADKQSENDEQS